ncbi:MAG: hypothetical protein AAGH40_03305 [Verrucomicrobiota bacterium]
MKKFLSYSLLIVTSALHGITVDESIGGDLSGAFASPDPFTLDLGNNTLIGQIGANGNTGATDGSDADYIFFTVEAGQELFSIVVDTYNTSGSSGSGSFFGYTEASSFTGQGIGDIDGSTIFSSTSGNLLPALQSGSTTPLPSGAYSFWLQETASVIVDYQITFATQAVPESSAAALLAGIIASATLLPRRLRRN